MKSFSHFITELNEGTNNAQFTGHLAELFTAVKAHGLAGALRITIKVLPATRGGGPVDKVLISCDSQLTLPKPTQPSDIFYLTDDAEPTRNHPRQHDLDLRVATDSRGGLRTMAGTSAAEKISDKFTNPDADGVITPKDAAQ